MKQKLAGKVVNAILHLATTTRPLWFRLQVQENLLCFGFSWEPTFGFWANLFLAKIRCANQSGPCSMLMENGYNGFLQSCFTEIKAFIRSLHIWQRWGIGSNNNSATRMPRKATHKLCLVWFYEMLHDPFPGVIWTSRELKSVFCVITNLYNAYKNTLLLIFQSILLDKGWLKQNISHYADSLDFV